MPDELRFTAEETESRRGSQSRNSLQQIWQAFLARPDQRNFEPVYTQTRALVWTLCRRILNNDEDARDAFQAAYARLFAEIQKHTFSQNTADPPGQALYRLAIHEANNLRMRRTRRAKREVIMDPLPTQPAPASGADTIAAQKEMRTRLDAIMDELPDETRVPLQLHYYDGLTQTEIAGLLEINQATISRRMDKGIKELEPLARRAGLGDVLGGLGVVTLGAALLQPPSAFSAAVIFTHAQAGLVAGGTAGAGMATMKSAGALKASIWSTATIKTAGLVASAAFIVGVGTIMTLGSIHKSEKLAERSKPAETSEILQTQGPLTSNQPLKEAKPDTVNLQKPEEKPAEKQLAQATTPVVQSISAAAGTSATLQMMQSAVPLTAGKFYSVGMTRAMDSTPKLYGPWKLADGNPIFVGDLGLLSVIGADRGDGSVRLVLLMGKNGPQTPGKFCGYDAEGGKHAFVEESSSLNGTEGPKLLVFRPERPMAAGEQIVALELQGFAMKKDQPQDAQLVREEVSQ